jgi:DICT domain-containing protein/predicted DNA-binding transcriptional regulator AlpA
MSLRIRDVVERTGITESTLRAWETRYGFPQPERLASGHRRYDEDDVALVRRAAELRAAGLPMNAAIEQARQAADRPTGSVFAALRRQRPELQVARLPKRNLVRISHAIEDESAYGASDLLLFGAFQQERHYRANEPRWRQLSRAAELAMVFADFPKLRKPRGGPIEVPIADRAPLGREWVLVCDGDDRAACLVAWELPGQDAVDDGDRLFETVWTADRAAARFAAQTCCALADPDLVAPIRDRLDQPVPPASEELRRAEALTGRLIAYLAAP